MMCALSACRVCLASDREMYRLANTALKETYERVTSGTLVVEGWPCCLCGVCLSALRRCRRFIDTAREANDTLDVWIQNQPNTDILKLKECPLFAFTRSPMKLVEIPSQEGCESRVKQESNTIEKEDYKMIHQQKEDISDKEDNIQTIEIKCEVTSDDGNDHTQVSVDESDKTQMSNNIESHSSRVLSHFEWVDIREEIVKVEYEKQILYDVKHDISDMLDDGVANNAPSTSNDGSLRVKKRNKLNEDTKSPALKRRRPITSDHQHRSTDPAATHNEGIMTFRQKSLKKKPLISLAGNKLLACKKCDYKTYQKLRLRRHYRKHITSGEKPFMCDKCNFKTNVKRNLKIHLITHTGEKPFACQLCDFRCIQKYSLKRHLSTHTGEKLFTCDKCDFKTNDKRNLKYHLMTHTGEKPFACHLCDFRCIHKYSLKRHLGMHIGEKPLACDKCDFKTNEKRNLKQHLMTHTGEKPFACTVCEFRCIQKYSLKRHLSTHTGEKLFACDKCDFKTNDKRNLKQHLMRHGQTVEKPFNCDKCDFKTNVKRNLKPHSMTHTGEKRFACNLCDFKCNQKYSLKRHLSTHIGEKPLNVSVTME